MSNQFTYFDNYTTQNPILIGEYAIVDYDRPNTTGPEWYTGAPRAFVPFWYGSVSEAIFLLGAERNSEKIISAMYAPSFQNLNRWQWIPDLIEYDAYPGHTTMSTSWHMIKLLSNNLITENLPITITEGKFGPAFFVAGRNDNTGSHMAKIANYNSTGSTTMNIKFDGVGSGAVGNLTYITAPMNATNPIGGSIVEYHSETVPASHTGMFSFQLPEYSVAILEVTAANAGGGQNYGNPGGRPGWKNWDQWGQQWGHGGQWGNGQGGWGGGHGGW